MSEKHIFSPRPLKSPSPDSINRSNIKVTKSPDLKFKHLPSKNNALYKISFD
jgi:hypothetical protein